MDETFTFWYLATPYTNYINGWWAAHIMACRLTALLIRVGIPVYSPIAHTHPIADIGLLDRSDHEMWMKIDEPMVRCASGLIVSTMESWEESKGITHEIAQFLAQGKPVIYWDPATSIPDELLLFL